jgi:hypothetical protein
MLAFRRERGSVLGQVLNGHYMAKELISKQTRIAFRDYLSSNEVLRTIRDMFDAADIACDLDHRPTTNTERRTLVEQYYHSLDLTKAADVRKLLEVYRGILERIDEAIEASKTPWNPDGDGLNEVRERHLKALTNVLKRDDWLYRNGEIKSVAGNHGFEELERHVMEFNLAHIKREIDRIKQSVDADPGQAIGTSKELVESCCKTILEAHGETPDRNVDLMVLVKATLKKLKLTPDDVPEAKRGADTIKTLLQRLGGMSHDLGEIRNLYGTGHGKPGTFKTLLPRHARLAVGVAGTLVMFLFETHQEQGTKGNE